MAVIVGRVTPVIVTMGVIFFLSHQPGTFFGPYSFDGVDKLAHFVIYSILSLSVIYAFTGKYRIKKKRLVVGTVMIVGLLYGVSDELHQTFIPGRFSTISDVVADVAGALFVCLIWLFFTRKNGAERAVGRERL